MWMNMQEGSARIDGRMKVLLSDGDGALRNLQWALPLQQPTKILSQISNTHRPHTSFMSRVLLPLFQPWTWRHSLRGSRSSSQRPPSELCLCSCVGFPCVSSGTFHFLSFLLSYFSLIIHTFIYLWILPSPPIKQLKSSNILKLITSSLTWLPLQTIPFWLLKHWPTGFRRRLLDLHCQSQWLFWPPPPHCYSWPSFPAWPPEFLFPGTLIIWQIFCWLLLPLSTI